METVSRTLTHLATETVIAFPTSWRNRKAPQPRLLITTVSGPRPLLPRHRWAASCPATAELKIGALAIKPFDQRPHDGRVKLDDRSTDGALARMTTLDRSINRSIDDRDRRIIVDDRSPGGALEVYSVIYRAVNLIDVKRRMRKRNTVHGRCGEDAQDRPKERPEPDIA